MPQRPIELILARQLASTLAVPIERGVVKGQRRDVANSERRLPLVYRIALCVRSGSLDHRRIEIDASHIEANWQASGLTSPAPQPSRGQPVRIGGR
jgi:hypothetical protein